MTGQMAEFYLAIDESNNYEVFSDSQDASSWDDVVQVIKFEVELPERPLACVRVKLVQQNPQRQEPIEVQMPSINVVVRP